MTISVAVTGKGGSGKTTVIKSLWRTLKKHYPDKSILLFDNDLASELGHSFGKDIRNTIYGIRSGKHEYKTGIPSKMTRQEYVEWAMEDIIFPLEENTDLLVTWLYKLTKDSNDFNLAATIGIIIFVISATFTLIAFSRSNAMKNEEGFQ